MKTRHCKMDTGQLLAYLEAPAQHPEVEVHLNTCPACQEKWARLSQVVLSPRTDRLTCGECQARLPYYVQAQSEGQEDVEQQFREVADHLALCPHCWQLYQELVQVNEMVITGSLPKPIPSRPPDLSFLRGKVPLEGIVRRGAFWAQNRARALILDMRAYFQALNRQPAWALAVRGEEYESKEILYRIILGPEQLEDLDVKVSVYRHPDRPEVARVVFYVCVPSRLLAGFAGSQVQMQAGEVIRTAQTNDDGQLIFEDVPMTDFKEAKFTIIPAKS